MREQTREVLIPCWQVALEPPDDDGSGFWQQVAEVEAALTGLGAPSNPHFVWFRVQQVEMSTPFGPTVLACVGPTCGRVVASPA